jgi:hypothetical protein
MTRNRIWVLRHDYFRDPKKIIPLLFPIYSLIAWANPYNLLNYMVLPRGIEPLLPA